VDDTTKRAQDISRKGAAAAAQLNAQSSKEAETLDEKFGDVSEAQQTSEEAVSKLESVTQKERTAGKDADKAKEAAKLTAKMSKALGLKVRTNKQNLKLQLVSTANVVMREPGRIWSSTINQMKPLVSKEGKYIQEDEWKSKTAIEKTKVTSKAILDLGKESVDDQKNRLTQEKRQLAAESRKFLLDYEGESEHVADKFENVREWLTGDVQSALEAGQVTKDQVRNLISGLRGKGANIEAELNGIQGDLWRRLAALNYSNAFEDLEEKLDKLIHTNETQSANYQTRVDTLYNDLTKFNESLSGDIADNEDSFRVVEDDIRKMNITAFRILHNEETRVDKKSKDYIRGLETLKGLAEVEEQKADEKEQKLIADIEAHAQKAAASYEEVNGFVNNYRDENGTVLPLNDIIAHMTSLIEDANHTDTQIRSLIRDQIDTRIQGWRSSVHAVLANLGMNISMSEVERSSKDPGAVVAAKLMDQGRQIAGYARMQSRMNEEKMRSAGKSLSAVLHELGMFRDTEQYSMEKELDRITAEVGEHTRMITTEAEELQQRIDNKRGTAEKLRNQVKLLKEKVALTMMQNAGVKEKDAATLDMEKFMLNQKILAAKADIEKKTSPGSFLETARLPPVQAAESFRRATAELRRHPPTDDAVEDDLAIVAQS